MLVEMQVFWSLQKLEKSFFKDISEINDYDHEKILDISQIGSRKQIC